MAGGVRLNIQELSLKNRLLSEARYYNRVGDRRTSATGYFEGRDILTGQAIVNLGSSSVQVVNISASGRPLGTDFPFTQPGRSPGYVDARPA